MSAVQKILDALSSPARREILWLVWDRQLPAGEIAAAVDLSAATISEHLAVLRDAGLVTMEPTGSFRRYRARQDSLRGLQSLVFGEGAKWTPADNLPERRHAMSGRGLVVTAAVEVSCDRPTVFAAFTDAELYSRWLGVPVSIEDGRFACRMEWGTAVRGVYDVVVPPSLIALRWDFEDDQIPVPGAELVGYMRFSDVATGTRVDVHQLVEREEQIDFMEGAWAMVLGRLKEGLKEGLKQGLTRGCGGTPSVARRPRPKRS